MNWKGIRIDKTSGSFAWGTGLIAMDIIEFEEDEFAAVGGSSGNVMTLLAWFGWSTTPVARFGDDSVGQFLRDALKTSGVDTSHISCESRVDTPIVIQRFRTDREGQRVHRFSLTCPECGAWLPRHRPITLQQANTLAKSKARPDVFHFDRVSPGAIRLGKVAREQGALVVFEPASVGDEKKFREAVDLCHVLKYSQERLGNVPDLAVTQAPKLIVETQGQQGLRFRWRKRWTHLDAVSTENPVDAAGSGDWCTAALIHMIGQQGSKGLEQLRKASLVVALRTGQTLAAINCQYIGARGAMMVMNVRQLNGHLFQLSDKALTLLVEDDTSTIGATPPDYCLRCGPNEALSAGDANASTAGVC